MEEATKGKQQAMSQRNMQAYLQVCLDVCLPARKRESMAAKMEETLKQWKMTETKSLETANILHWSCHDVLACTAPIQSPNLR